MGLDLALLRFVYLFFQVYFFQIQDVKADSIPILIKDDGVKELKKEDVAMIFYITVTNTGIQEPLHLLVSSKRCCRKVASDDEDCDSMKLRGGDMGKLFPTDIRNLTLIYSNLYLQDREGTCDIEIKTEQGAVQDHQIKFDTNLIRDGKTRIPRLMENYYKLEEVTSCTNVDQNPLNNCQPYECEIRYDGTRNYFDPEDKKCKILPKCLDQNAGTKEETSGLAYILETNTCTKLVDTMGEQDFQTFNEGKPSVRGLTHVHSYPINVQCHSGHRDPKGRWCLCNPGWESAPFNHRTFNPDVQMYHMCSVWTGHMSAEEARNITVMPKNIHKTTNIVIFSLLAVAFMALFALLIFYLVRQKPWKKSATSVKPEDEMERMALTETHDSDTE
ncbi:hypothetical protein AVEN_8996-1 [Araneus ventricosus]|uniref:Uncharacterized protein n=1 Tax=Araneus ventricosus TaxID=182803 RepID=A0A4Y2DS96_ARAVE|nr:hypothetical protein AVEN_8996-1 [Araneus ventricosus]